VSDKSTKIVDEATATLTAAGIGSPRVDAELLLAHVLGVERSALPLRTLDEPAARRFDALVRRRAQREPLQYLTGEAPFRYDLLAVGPGVFIPRPETELLVDAVLPALRRIAAPVVVDLCSGSGALAVAIAHEVSGAQVIAVERSPAALEWLRRNAAGAAIEIIDGDVTDPGLLADRAGTADVVVSNPPYVPSTVTVQPEVAADPAEAVFAGPDGLAIIPSVVEQAARLLRPGGMLAFEHDETQHDAVMTLLAPERWIEPGDHRDLTGRWRYATAVRRSSEGKIAG
jgi:release factor glutamine methyltransferase